MKKRTMATMNCSAQPQSEQYICYIQGDWRCYWYIRKERQMKKKTLAMMSCLHACLLSDMLARPAGAPPPHIFLQCHYHPHSHRINTTVLVLATSLHPTILPHVSLSSAFSLQCLVLGTWLLPHIYSVSLASSLQCLDTECLGHTR